MHTWKISLLFFSSLLFFVSLISIIQMAESARPAAPSSAVHIIYTELPQDEEPEAYHMRLLSNVVGSEEVAKEALLYSYKNAASGFSATLTPEQVTEMSKQPGVLQVLRSRTLQLHSGPGRLH
ncbi:hypothetical protein Dsin_002307 [Dipteronia sinensis]|uniref:Inhibitor I9 domain-containing protein n=1 Tax=Dipteronia sinensis TaxID=43782 RepID=A0AAE0B5I9_9ROSI|nr:hypothetical protein Dsin_002307 [Dipteronia sinensis]